MPLTLQLDATYLMSDWHVLGYNEQRADTIG